MDPYVIVGPDGSNPDTHVIIDVDVPGQGTPRTVSAINGQEQLTADEVAANTAT